MNAKPTKNAKSGEDAADPVSRFEADLKALEDIVSQMEGGDLPLEQSLKLFERGTALAKNCRRSLEAAELRVTRVTAETESTTNQDEKPA